MQLIYKTGQVEKCWAISVGKVELLVEQGRVNAALNVQSENEGAESAAN